MATTLGLIGVPTSMGAFAPGQEKGPTALREADLVGRLSRSGVGVADHGDLAVRRWRPDRENRRAQNLTAVAEVARETAGRRGGPRPPAGPGPSSPPASAARSLESAADQNQNTYPHLTFQPGPNHQFQSVYFEYSVITVLSDIPDQRSRFF